MTEQYYNANVGALLFMGQSTATPLPAPGADSFVEVPLTGQITPPPINKSTGHFNVTNDGNRRSVGGKKEDQQVVGNVVIDWTEQTHVDMYNDADADGDVKRNWYILYPDENNRRLDFVGFMNKWEEEPFDAGEEAKEHRANWGIAIDGGTTATA